MKKQTFHRAFISLFILLFLTAPGCVTTSTPILKMPKSLPPIVKDYKHITLQGNIPGMINTGLYIDKGETYSILATGSIDLWPAGLEYHDVRPEHGWYLMARFGGKEGGIFCITRIYHIKSVFCAVFLPPLKCDQFIRQ